jgi:zinc transport system substrate-binding protein
MILMRRAAAALALVAATPFVTGCGAVTGSEPDGTQVVASFYPLEYVAERVAGGHADVTGLTVPGQEPHDLELSFEQTAQVSEADVVLFSRGFQPAVDDAVDQSSVEHVVDGSDVNRGGDPHFWLDPTRLSSVAARLTEELAAADPEHEQEYADNLATLQQDLEVLDGDFQEGLESCARDTVVVSHDAFGYLGARYGLDLRPINGLSPDAEPSPAHLAELADLIESEGITTVFSETLASPELADSLAGDLGLEAAVLDPVEGLADETEDEDYLSLMRANLAALQKANDCS